MTLNDPEWLFHVKIRFLPALLESERLHQNVVQPLRFCGVLCIAYRYQLASLGRHAQLTRCFSAVAELLVYMQITLMVIVPIIMYRIVLYSSLP